MIESLRGELKSRRALVDLLPDVQIYHKAVDWALRYDEFYKSNEVQVARGLLQQGTERARALRGGWAPWTNATGLIVRGYVSKIDGSVQPYGLVVPASYQSPGPQKFRLDFWFHGRGETLTELDFINGRQKSPGEFTPPDTFVLHLYGRYCNANKFAGETDLFEALDDVKKHYPIDENRLVVRGFSLGGGLLAVCDPLRRTVGGSGARRGVFRDSRFSESFPERSGQAELVRAEALALVRLHGLRGEFVPLPHGGLQRGDRPTEAGGRRDGRRSEGGGDRTDAHHRTEDGACLSSAGERGNQSAH